MYYNQVIWDNHPDHISRKKYIPQSLHIILFIVWLTENQQSRKITYLCVQAKLSKHLKETAPWQTTLRLSTRQVEIHSQVDTLE